MEKLVWQGLLYDFYGELLTEHQKKIYESVVYENLSLAEIAEQNGISRQGVHDIVRRCDASLEQYEKRLGLIGRYEKIKTEFAQMKDIITVYEKDRTYDRDRFCSQITDIADSITRQL